MPSILYTNSTSPQSTSPPMQPTTPGRQTKGRSMQSLHSCRQNPRFGSAVPRGQRYSSTMQQRTPGLKAFPTPTLDTISDNTSASSLPALKSTPVVSSATGMPSVWTSTVSVSGNAGSTRTSSGSQRTTSDAPSKAPALAVKGKNDADAALDAYRLRYAKMLASQFNMSMDAALAEAEFHLKATKPEAGTAGNSRARNVRHYGVSEAEVARDSEWSS